MALDSLKCNIKPRPSLRVLMRAYVCSMLRSLFYTVVVARVSKLRGVCSGSPTLRNRWFNKYHTKSKAYYVTHSLSQILTMATITDSQAFYLRGCSQARGQHEGHRRRQSSRVCSSRRAHYANKRSKQRESEKRHGGIL
jgi:hypothetical protein